MLKLKGLKESERFTCQTNDDKKILDQKTVDIEACTKRSGTLDVPCVTAQHYTVYDSTAIHLQQNQSTTYVTTEGLPVRGLLHSEAYIGQIGRAHV